MAVKLSDTLRTYADGIQGKNELKVGLLMCNDVMLQAADALEKKDAELKKLRASLQGIIDENKRSRQKAALRRNRT